MDGFQSLRCLWKPLHETVPYIMSKTFKAQNLTKKYPLQFLKIAFANLDPILHYIEAKFDYRFLKLIYLVWSYNSTQKNQVI